MVQSGLLTRVAALSAADAYLTCDPQMTFFKGVHKRYTNFANGHIMQQFETQFGYGQRIQAKLDRSGDLVRDIFLYVQLDPIEYLSGIFNPPVSIAFYTNGIGYAIINHAEVTIGGHDFDLQWGQWMFADEMIGAKNIGLRMHEQIGFFEGDGPASAVDELVQFSLITRYLYAPFRFWFNKHYQQSLPLIALQYHEVRIKILTNPSSVLVEAFGAAAIPGNIIVPTIQDMHLVVELVMLDTLERRLMAHASHEYVIEQVQFAGAQSVSSTSTSQTFDVRIFNHPCRYLMLLCNRTGQPINDFSGVTDSLGIVHGPIATMQFKINGHEINMYQPEVFYRCVVHRDFCNCIAPNVCPFIYIIPFGLQLHTLQPNGTLNFSRIDNAQINVTYPSGLTWNGNALIYAVNFNVVKIVSGMGGIRFAN